MGYSQLYQLKENTLNNGLIAHYPFNGNANDISGNNYHGTVFGATLTTNRFGIINSAYNFDGVDDYIQVPKKVLNRGTNNFTINGWVKSSDYSKRNMIITSYDSYVHTPTAIGIVLECGGSYTWFFIKNTLNERYFVRYNGTLKNNNSYMLTGIRANNIMYFYINSKFIGKSIVSGNVNITAGYNYIGKINYGFSIGTIDDVRIYNRALSTSEIKALYRERP